MTNEKKIVARAILLTIILLLVIAVGGAVYFEKMHVASEKRLSSIPVATSESETGTN